jgi:magnesium chelatase family protein
VARYRGRISGPLWDRIDLRVEVPRQEATELLPAPEPASQVDKGRGARAPAQEELQQRVAVARTLQQRRAGRLNARLPVQSLATDCLLDGEARTVLERCQKPWRLTGRGLHRILRVARTIADLESSERLRAAHVAEAVQFHRPMV